MTRLPRREKFRLAQINQRLREKTLSLAKWQYVREKTNFLPGLSKRGVDMLDVCGLEEFAYFVLATQTRDFLARPKPECKVGCKYSADTFFRSFILFRSFLFSLLATLAWDTHCESHEDDEIASTNLGTLCIGSRRVKVFDVAPCGNLLGRARSLQVCTVRYVRIVRTYPF